MTIVVAYDSEILHRRGYSDIYTALYSDQSMYLVTKREYAPHVAQFYAEHYNFRVQLNLLDSFEGGDANLYKVVREE
jgi:hypothetical protein